jgi:hypothetical protein
MGHSMVVLNAIVPVALLVKFAEPAEFVSWKLMTALLVTVAPALCWCC